jgi:hypothetical protein
MYIVYLQENATDIPAVTLGDPFSVLFVQLSLLYSANPLPKNTTPFEC